MNKYLLGFAALILIGTGFWGHSYWKATKEFRYFSADCSIYERSGKIVFHSPEDYCDFANDGKLLSSVLDTNTLQLRDPNGTVLWTSNEYAHHDLKFSRDGKSIIAITAESILLKNTRVKSDCFSKRDLTNKVIHRWCLGDNLPKLEELGFQFNPVVSDDPEYETNKQIKTRLEISHANSIYEIPQNTLSGQNAAFAEGNFLVNIYSPSFALIILDREMKNVLWAKDLGKIPHEGKTLRLITHDTQVTEDGKILTYVNYFQKNPDSTGPSDFFRQVSLMKMDPVSGSIDWLFREKAERDDFKSLVHGTVEILKNGNLFYSVVSDATNKSEVYEIAKDGGIVWSFKLPNELNSNAALRVKKAKPVYDLSFLNARGIL